MSERRGRSNSSARLLLGGGLGCGLTVVPAGPLLLAVPRLVTVTSAELTTSVATTLYPMMAAGYRACGCVVNGKVGGDEGGGSGGQVGASS